MDYFDDLNPYLVKEDDNENLTRQQTVPPTQPVEQTYVENILRVNVGKKGTFYFSYITIALIYGVHFPLNTAVPERNCSADN